MWCMEFMRWSSLMAWMSPASSNVYGNDELLATVSESASNQSDCWWLYLCARIFRHPNFLFLFVPFSVHCVSFRFVNFVRRNDFECPSDNLCKCMRLGFKENFYSFHTKVFPLALAWEHIWFSVVIYVSGESTVMLYGRQRALESFCFCILVVRSIS